MESHDGRGINVPTVSAEGPLLAYLLGARIHTMASNHPPRNPVELLAWRWQQLAVCNGALSGVGNSISAANVAVASLRTGLEIDLVNRDCAPAVVRPSN